MKKILEVLRYGDGDIRFNTDVDPVKQPKEVADLSLCVNRKEMIRNLDSESAQMAKALREAMCAFQEDGGKAFVFGPGIKPPKMRN